MVKIYNEEHYDSDSYTPIFDHFRSGRIKRRQAGDQIMTDIINTLDLDYEEWVRLCTDKWKLPRYRADQICQWIYQKKVFNIPDMTNLSKELRNDLALEMFILPPSLMKEEVSSIDGTTKYLWSLLDGETIESVVIFHGNHTTACISSQVGCPLGCGFCATGQSGFTRNLSVAEIVGQFLAMEKRAGKDINNIVYMGMGEPLLNIDNVLKSIKILNHPKQRKLGIRNISVSTSGIIPGIETIAEFDLPVRLSVSLHASTDRIRSRLMPVNNKYPLNPLIGSLKNYQEKTGERITIEYIMIDGINDSKDMAYELISLLSGLDVFVNLIPCNPVNDKYRRSSPETVKAFSQILKKFEIEVEIRKEKGTDINAACGQLRKTIR